MPQITQIQVRRSVSGPSNVTGTWAQVNPRLAAGEIGFETDTGRFKIGDGTTLWNALKYATDSSYLTGSIIASNVSGTVAVDNGGTGKTTFGATPGVLKSNGATPNVLTASAIVDADIASNANIVPSKISGTAATLVQQRARLYQGTTTLDVPARQFITAAAPIVNGITRGYLFTPEQDMTISKISYYVATAANPDTTNSGATATGSVGATTITMALGTGTGGAWSSTSATPTTGMKITGAGIPDTTTIVSYSNTTKIITISNALVSGFTGAVGSITITVPPWKAKAGLYSVSTSNEFAPITGGVSVEAASPFTASGNFYDFSFDSLVPFPVLTAGNTYAVALLSNWTGSFATTPQLSYHGINGGNLAGAAPQITFTLGTTGSQTTFASVTGPGGTNTPYYARLTYS